MGAVFSWPSAFGFLFEVRGRLFRDGDVAAAAHSMTNSQPSPETRLQMLGARQAALTEVLGYFNRLTLDARDRLTADGDPTALEDNWRRLHHWLAEAGRENLVELSLIRHELGTALDPAEGASNTDRWPSPSTIVRRLFPSFRGIRQS